MIYQNEYATQKHAYNKFYLQNDKSIKFSIQPSCPQMTESELLDKFSDFEEESVSFIYFDSNSHPSQSHIPTKCLYLAMKIF